MERYRALLRERLGERLVEIRLFGSAARGDMWAAHWPMHSDIDLLVVTRGAISEEMQDELVDEATPGWTPKHTSRETFEITMRAQGKLPPADPPASSPAGEAPELYSAALPGR
jgi:hypothetical protein